MAKIKNKSKERTNTRTRNLSEIISPVENLTFDFKYKYLKTLRNKKFSNRLLDEADFAKYVFNVQDIMIKLTISKWQVGQYSKNTRKISDPKERDVVIDILKQLHGDEVETEELQIWKLAHGNHEGTRLFCTYNELRNTMTPIFVDYYHMINNNYKYSKKEILKYNNFCPHLRYS